MGMSYTKLTGVALAALLAGPAIAQEKVLTIWSWDIAAKSLSDVAAKFKEQHPDVKVVVEDLGGQQVFDRTLAGCAAGGAGLPDIVTIENGKAEIFWSRFAGCFADLRPLGYGNETAAMFPEFKRAELEHDGVPYAMPWDSGPVAVFYRRDFYANANVDPATIATWDDYVAAGQAVAKANPGVAMTQIDLNGSDWFRMVANEQNCAYFSLDGASITIAQPGCVTALDVIKKLHGAGIVSEGDWNARLQASAAGTVASQMSGGWYEGSIRSVAASTSGKWGVHLMPAGSATSKRAANLGGSALAIPAASRAQQTAYDFLTLALATKDSQIAMLRDYGLVPSLNATLDDPYIAAPQEFWGGQAVWKDILGTLKDIEPSRGTQFYADADSILVQVQTAYVNGEFPDAAAALNSAAQQIAGATGLPIAE